MLFHCGLETDRAVEAVDAVPRFRPRVLRVKSIVTPPNSFKATALCRLGARRCLVLMLRKDAAS